MDDALEPQVEALKKLTEEFVWKLLDLENPFPEALLAEVVRNGDNVQSREEAMHFINEWRGRFTTITANSYTPQKPVSGPNDGLYFLFNCSYQAVEPPRRVHVYEGDAAVQVMLVGKELKIVGCSMPGFEF